ncbi:MAG: hypothetical protein ACREQ4_05055, partial [Candidatus Binataceae bacterium]
MSANGNYINYTEDVRRQKLRELYDQNAAARAMLDDFRRRERNRMESKVDSLTYLKIGHRPVTRAELIRIFQELAQIGCGIFIVGRRSHPTR